MSSPEHAAVRNDEDTKQPENPNSDEKWGKTKSPTMADEPKLTADSPEDDDEQDDLHAEDGYADSSFGGSDGSDTTSVTSSIAQGIVENGRRYQVKREGEYWGPADEKQVPIPSTAQNILDVGTGTGTWAKEVADQIPAAVVTGFDLAPPPTTWVPPNCKLEVDDALKPWLFSHKMDLVHIRDLYGSFSNEHWRVLYKQAYDNLAPGGWIEQLETDIVAKSDDGSLPEDSYIGSWVHHIRSRIEDAGITNVHEKRYKVPLGDWVRDPVMKEAGRFQKTQLLEGMEGYSMFTLTRFGKPTPWTPDQVQFYLAKVRQEINTPGLHAYYERRRVWAQKPFE